MIADPAKDIDTGRSRYADLQEKQKSLFGVGRSFENKILMRFAPYALLRSLSRRLFGKDVPGQLQPALLSVSPDVRTLAFIVEEHTDGEFTLFVPLAAAPGVGNIQIVSATKVE